MTVDNSATLCKLQDLMGVCDICFYCNSHNLDLKYNW